MIQPGGLISYAWRGPLDGIGLEGLHAEAFGHVPGTYDWRAQLDRHSLGWVTAREAGRLLGFVNLAWDGGSHAFLLDLMVASHARRRGIGRALVTRAATHARTAGCEWLHADFEPRLRDFYFVACGFSSSAAGLIKL